MRVFVVGPGRCGTSTFYQTCRFIDNFTCGHESLEGPKNVGHWEYPDNHIEVASHLTIGLPHLLTIYPEAFWIVLRRQKKDCVKSLAENCERSIQNWARQWWYYVEGGNNPVAATAYYEWCYALYSRLISGAWQIPIEDLSHRLPQIWKRIGAKGDLENAQRVARRRYNTASYRGRNHWEGER